MVEIITSFCRLCEFQFLFVDLLSLSQRQNYGRRRGKTDYGGEFPSTSYLRDRSVSCFVVSDLRICSNATGIYLSRYPLRKIDSPVRAKALVPRNTKQKKIQIASVNARIVRQQIRVVTDVTW